MDNCFFVVVKTTEILKVYNKTANVVDINSPKDYTQLTVPPMGGVKNK